LILSIDAWLTESTHERTQQVVIMGRRAQFLEQAATLLGKDGIQAACTSVCLSL
jgi:hypothetical protein